MANNYVFHKMTNSIDTVYTELHTVKWNVREAPTIKPMLSWQQYDLSLTL